MRKTLIISVLLATFLGPMGPMGPDGGRTRRLASAQRLARVPSFLYFCIPKSKHMNEKEILQWLQEVQHPAKEDQNVVALGLVEKIHIADNAVHVTGPAEKLPGGCGASVSVPALARRNGDSGGHRCQGAGQSGTQGN